MGIPSKVGRKMISLNLLYHARDLIPQQCTRGICFARCTDFKPAGPLPLSLPAKNGTSAPDAKGEVSHKATQENRFSWYWLPTAFQRISRGSP